MRVTSNVSTCAIMKALLANELPDLGNPSMTTCLSGVSSREILTCAQQSIKTELDGGVAARVILEPFLEPQGGDVFVQVWSQSLLDSLHRASPSVLSPSILHTLPVAGSTRRPESMLVTEDTSLSALRPSGGLVDANSYAYVFHVGAYVCQQRVDECCEAQHFEHLFDRGLQALEDRWNGTCSLLINYSAEGGHYPIRYSS